MAKVMLTARIPAELLERINAATGKASRTDWLIAAIERRLGPPVVEPGVDCAHPPYRRFGRSCLACGRDDL